MCCVLNLCRSGFWVGAAQTASWMKLLSVVSVTEMVGVKYRRTVGILYQMFFSIGNLILPLLAYFITDWRWLQVTITAPFVLFLSYYWWVQLMGKRHAPSDFLSYCHKFDQSNKKNQLNHLAVY